ncbi:MAG: DEAD/DEAH box helicase family protein, partial [archaeon]|nr:DEAD/DEAH box helicase family protein [archaeon]
MDSLTPQTVFTGCFQDPLESALCESIRFSERLDIISSFIQVSGIREIQPALKEAVSQGSRIRVLTGTYLGITDPDALLMLKDICGDSLEIRFYDGTNSFHPKAYFVYSPSGDSVFVGSSNLSRSALRDGVEWNYRIFRKDHPSDFARFEDMFDMLWNQRSVHVGVPEIEKYRNTRRIQLKIRPDAAFAGPNDVQTMALEALERTRNDGMCKALVVAATGTGKTYLAAMDSKGFGKILFVAHSMYILEQARKAFETVRPGDSAGYLCNGKDESDKDMVFATIQTLERRIDTMDPCMFDYVVVDEFHHAASRSYRKALDRLRPKFMLGLTATPERMDCQEVFALCDNNVVYEIRLLEAVDRGYLCPFRYKGIHDTVDYGKVKFLNGHYDIDSLELELNQERRADLVF